MRWRALVLGLVCVLLVGCGGIEAAPSWDEMTDEERRVHCEGVQTRYQVTDWSRSRSSGGLYRFLSLQLERCQRGGYV